MKIVLTTLPKEGSAFNWVTPKYFYPDDSKFVPLGLLSLASNLPSEHEITVLDPNSFCWSIDKTIEEIEKQRPDILGISAVTLKAYSMVKILKETSAPYKIVGGPHTTNNSSSILNQGADATFIGQLADLEFVDAIKNKPKGIVYCNTNLNQIKFPNRKFIDINFYYPSSILFSANNRMSTFSSVGCPHHCSFCDVQTKKIQRKSPESLLEEMIYLQKIGAKSIHLMDDNFNTNESYLESICSEMDKKEFYSEWSGRGQAKISPHIANMLSERNFKRIHVGFESLSDKTLKFFNKPQNFSQIQKFCETTNKYGIDILGYFIIGAPTETEEDKHTMAQKINDLGIKYPYINILQPLPNTEYYSFLLNEGIYKKDYWAEYISNPVPDFMLPFPYGEKKWQEDAEFVNEMINLFKEKNENE